MRSIALVGKSGSGKSSVAKLINVQLGIEIVSTGAICRQIAGLLFGNQDKATTQLLDDALIGIDPSIFLKAATRDVPDEALICVDALRFTSDMAIARKRNMITLKIVAPAAVRNERLVRRNQGYNSDVDQLHRSETDLDDALVDHAIVNTGSLEQLAQAVESFCQSIK